jgi:alcohol dehydrogenase class IV
MSAPALPSPRASALPAGRQLSLPGSAPVEFGPGAIKRLPQVVSALGVRRLIVVTDPGIRAAGVLASVLAPLDGAGVPCAVFGEVHANPSTADVLAGVAVAAPLLDDRTDDVAVLAVGGGSALDVAKGVALLAAGTDLDAALGPGEHPGLPVVAVPTTAGTGAETNGFAVLADPDTGTKVYLGAPSVRPRVAVLDPELTLGVPALVTAATGMDALTHGIESFVSRGSHPLSEAYALRAVSMVARSLERAVRDGSDLEARSDLLLAAHLAGLALTLSGLGLVHGIAHATTGHTGAPHGLALSAVLDAVMTASLPAAVDGYSEVARALGAGASPDGAVEAVTDLGTRIGARAPLSSFGVTEQMLPSLARDALADPVSRNAPWLPTVQSLVRLLTARLSDVVTADLG